MSLPADQIQAIDMRLSAMAGRNLSAFRKSYGRMAHAHVGRLVPKKSPPEKAVHKDRGEFVIEMLDCDREVTFAGRANSLTSLADGDGAVLEALAAMVGHVVSEVSIEPESLALRISFTNGTEVRLIPDEALGPESEQWIVTFPDDTALVAKGVGVLGFES